MNRHYIIEVKPGAWRRAVIEAAVYALAFMAVGYFLRGVL